MFTSRARTGGLLPPSTRVGPSVPSSTANKRSGLLIPVTLVGLVALIFYVTVSFQILFNWPSAQPDASLSQNPLQAAVNRYEAEDTVTTDIHKAIKIVRTDPDAGVAVTPNQPIKQRPIDKVKNKIDPPPLTTNSNSGAATELNKAFDAPTRNNNVQPSPVVPVLPVVPTISLIPPPPPPPPPQPKQDDIDIPVLVFTFNRPQNLKITIDSLLSYMPARGHTLYISQDGDDPAVKSIAQEYQANGKAKYLNFHYQQPEHPAAEYFRFPSYFKIAQHYQWALGQIFDVLGHEKVIIIEDDMRIAPDFYSYFRATHRLLDEDKSLLCVSAWNDNGQGRNIFDAKSLYRSDCFPGLGWLLSKSIWGELRHKWPQGFWDDWLREPPQRQGRSCIFPEINRVYTFGAQGASGGQFYDQYLKDIKLNDVNVDWSQENLSYLKKDAYEDTLRRWLSTAKELGSPRDIDAANENDSPTSTFYVLYDSLDHYTGLLQSMGLMTDHKAGVPRTSFEGVIVVRRGKKKLLFVKRDSPLRRPR